MRAVANVDRLSGLDSSFLHLERDGAHMHVAGCAIFEGTARKYVRDQVDDPELQEKLTPHYSLGCKRPGFHNR